MKNQAPELDRQRFGMPDKDKRALVLFLFGALLLTSEIPWPTKVIAPNQYALIWEATETQPTIQLLGSTPSSPSMVASKPFERLDPRMLIPENIPARYALFLQQSLPVNRADTQSLQLLPGVGPHLASAIRDYIDMHGPLVQSEELLQVAGIGPKTLERLSPFIRLDQRTPP